MSKVVYTWVDEAPMLASVSFLPIVKAFLKHVEIDVDVKDLSLAGRILAAFSDRLGPDQQHEDALAALALWVQSPEATIIKLPNISASVPQLQMAIRELQEQGFTLPDYDAQSAARYAKVLGSAVNPVLREGNSDRRVAAAVKYYAKLNPHPMGAWSADSLTHVSSMQQGDFYASERSKVMKKNAQLRIVFYDENGNERVLREGLSVKKGDVLDVSFMKMKDLRSFVAAEIQDAHQQGLLFSLHLKATMMKVSDPLIFGCVVETYFQALFDDHRDIFKELGVKGYLGLGDLYEKIKQLPAEKQHEIKQQIEHICQHNASLAMVDSTKGISNLHVPSDVIIDASMPAMIRQSGKMWGPDGKLQACKAVIPDRRYAGVYQAVIEFCKAQGAFDPRTMGSVSNVGLMAKKAEEYGSHDKTFQMSGAGRVVVFDEEEDEILFESAVEKDDIWRMCQTEAVAIQDWFRLGIQRARVTGQTAVFWLDEQSEHDAHLMTMLNAFLKQEDCQDVTIKIMAPQQATLFTCQEIKAGRDVISVTGNVLRDYLTDLFPILELGTSAKMLSIVPLLAGGGLYETGAGGSAPRLVTQFIEENHLRWDSLGEFLALAASLDALALKKNDARIAQMAAALNHANERYLTENKAPVGRVKTLDNRGSHFYLALFWAEALSQSVDEKLRQTFETLFLNLKNHENQIMQALLQDQGKSVDLGGYYRVDAKKVQAIMRPSGLFNSFIDGL